jgi:hypothetical protein
MYWLIQPEELRTAAPEHSKEQIHIRYRLYDFRSQTPLRNPESTLKPQRALNESVL